MMINLMMMMEMVMVIMSMLMMINLIATIDLKAVEGLEELHEGLEAPVGQVATA